MQGHYYESVVDCVSFIMQPMGLAKGNEKIQTIPWVYMIRYWHPWTSVIGLLQNGSNYFSFCADSKTI